MNLLNPHSPSSVHATVRVFVSRSSQGRPVVENGAGALLAAFIATHRGPQIKPKYVPI